jgi:hypothetical protein
MLKVEKLQAGAPKLGERFVIPQGDGNEFFSEPRSLRLAEATWFPGRVPRGDALLFVVEEGVYAGQYVALTTRTLADLKSQISKFGWASVIVHLIRNPTSTFAGDEQSAVAIGMAWVKRL